MTFLFPENSKTEELSKAIALLKTSAEVKLFLRDLLTETEINEFSNRWLAARLLSKNISYTRIQKQTGLSSATIARISKWLNGKLGGYRLIIGRLYYGQPHSNLEEKPS